MSRVLNRIRKGFYLDSVALMRLSRSLACMDGVEDAAVMMGTPANRAILETADLLADEGQSATAGDLVIAIRAATDSAATLALTAAEEALCMPATQANTMTAWRPRSLVRAKEQMPDANLVLISTPGQYATTEARNALRNGMHVMIFSDNVSLDDEVALKREAAQQNLLVMGPDCGTAIIGGIPLAFANRVRAGSIGIVGASGTGIQEVSCLVDRLGGGITHAIGVGGRDLTAAVGGTATLMALDALAADGETHRLVVIAKPPDADVARRVIARLADLHLPSVVCFLGASPMTLPATVQQAHTLKDAALLALETGESVPPTPELEAPAGRIVGLYAGGTLCAEAQVIARDGGLAVRSNVPIAGAEAGREGGECLLLDLGDDEFTRGRPHPMIEPTVRDAPLSAALGAQDIAIILVDLILGQGAHANPAGALLDCLAQSDRRPGPLVICSVTGTEADSQMMQQQVRQLENAGVIVAPSNADASRWAVALRNGPREMP